MKKGFWLYSLILISTLEFTPSKNSSTKANDLFVSTISFSKDYFPTDPNKKLIYESDFGESVLLINKESNMDIFTFKGDDFIYRQKLVVNDNGVFVKETYQKMKVLFVFNKESTFTYNEPLPRIKYPLEVGTIS